VQNYVVSMVVEIHPGEAFGVSQILHYREKHILCLIASFRVLQVFVGGRMCRFLARSEW
jgi:hypothetical protein